MMIDPRILALSSPAEDEASLQAATDILCLPDPGTEIDRLYPVLLRHQTLLQALAHLERAGADLEGLSLSAPLFSNLFPLNTLLPTPNEASSEQIPLAALPVQRGMGPLT